MAKGWFLVKNGGLQVLKCLVQERLFSGALHLAGTAFAPGKAVVGHLSIGRGGFILLMFFQFEFVENFPEHRGFAGTFILAEVAHG